MIDFDKGLLILEKSKISLSPELSIKEFKNNITSLQIHHINDMKNGYVWYAFLEEIILGEYSIIKICFGPNGLLQTIMLVPNKNEFPDWSCWSREKMIEDKAYNDEWLLRWSKDARTVQKYSWGGIGSYFDEKSGSSHITMSWCYD